MKFNPALLLVALLAACASNTVPSTQTIRADFQRVASATAVGTVYDFFADQPLAHVSVYIAKWERGAPYRKVGVTDDNGNFRFSAQVGTYLLRLGNGKPQTYLHQRVVLDAGSNEIVGTKPSPEPEVQYVKSQRLGHLRLMLLNDVQEVVIDAMNRGREKLHLHRLDPDEYLEEDAVADNQEQSAQGKAIPTPLFGYGQPLGSVSYMIVDPDHYVSGDRGRAYDGKAMALVSLGLWAGDPKSIIDAVRNPAFRWFGGDFEGANKAANLVMGAEEWNEDPR